MTISLPFMAGPISRRLVACDFLAVSVLLLMFFYGLWPAIGAFDKKTHDRCQPWVFVEILFSFDKPRRHRRLPEPRLPGLVEH